MWLALISLATADPSPGEDYHVPLFVDVHADFWTVSVLGETPIALNGVADTLALVETTLDRCPRVSTVVVRPDPDAPWSRSASALMGVQRAGKVVALQGETVDRGGAGHTPIEAEGRLKRAGGRAVVSLTDMGLALDGLALCREGPDAALCGDDFRYLRSQIGGRGAALLVSPQTETGLVLHLFRALSDFDPVFAAQSGNQLARFEAAWLPDTTTWVAMPCDRPMDGSP